MTNKLIRYVAQSIVDGTAFRPRVALCYAPEMADPAKRKAKLASIGLPVSQPPPAPAAPAPAPVDAELAAADKLIKEVASRLDASDLEELRAADRSTKIRFAKQLQNQRALNEEQRQRDAAEHDRILAEEKAKANNRLARLGAELGKAERDR